MPTTAQRGYGYGHQRARREALARLQPGDPCHFCGHGMYPTQALALDHTVDRTGYRGLTHAACNQLDGARRGGRARHQRGRPKRWQSRTW